MSGFPYKKLICINLICIISLRRHVTLTRERHIFRSLKIVDIEKIMELIILNPSGRYSLYSSALVHFLGHSEKHALNDTKLYFTLVSIATH